MEQGVSGTGLDDRSKARPGRIALRCADRRGYDERATTEYPAPRIAAASPSSLTVSGSNRTRASRDLKDTVAFRTPGSRETNASIGARNLRSACRRSERWRSSRCALSLLGTHDSLCRKSGLRRCPPAGFPARMPGQCIDDRASPQSATARTGGNQFVERSPDLLELRDLAAHFCKFDHRLLTNISAVGPRIGSQRKQLRDLTQGEAELLRLPDEADALDHLIVIQAVAAASRPRRLLDQSTPLVEADGLDADARPLGSAADGHRGRHGTLYVALRILVRSQASAKVRRGPQAAARDSSLQSDVPLFGRQERGLAALISDLSARRTSNCYRQETPFFRIWSQIRIDGRATRETDLPRTGRVRERYHNAY